MIEKNFKRGVAMIELIFAIVVIGIVLLSTPMLIQQAINSTYVTAQQESIAAVAVHSGIVLTKFWDEVNAKQENSIDGVSPIVEINNSMPTLNYKGLAGSNSVRTTKVVDRTLLPTVIGFDDVNETITNFDDVDDVNNESISLTLYNSESTSTDTTIGTGDYLDKNITIRTYVTFVTDIPTSFTQTTTRNIDPTSTTSNFTNIKLIKATLTTNNQESDLNKTITLYSFSCNLGTYSVEGDEFK